MKKIVIYLAILLFTVVNVQAGTRKITKELDAKIQIAQDDEDILIWAFFKDKGLNKEQLCKQPQLVVSEKSLQRRAKVFAQSSLIDETDLPVNSSYISALTAQGFKVKQVSKWLNGVSGYIKKAQLSKISALECVAYSDIVYKLKKETPVTETLNKTASTVKQPAGVYSLDYGASYTQLKQINVPAVHNLGITGAGVVIGSFDAGFSNLAHEAFASMKIIAEHDFVNNRSYVGNGQGGMGDGTHGTETLSTIGGYKPGQLIGPAYGAKFILAKTENTESETPVEEDNWIAAAEWADSIGVDVITSSLGYVEFDAPYQSYTWQSMDGKTCRITVAADLAVQKGIVVVNSAGNDGYNADHNTLGAPSDGFYVITAGAVTATGEISYFSSVGNTVDGRTKPDVMAMGSNVVVASPSATTGYTNANGTSFSCPLSAGVAALILSAKPSLTPLQVRDVMRTTASNSASPNRQYGWGVLDALKAINSATVPVELTSFSANLNKGAVLLNWTTATEKNNYGFEIERGTRDANDLSKINWIAVGFKKGNGTTVTVNNYSFTDKLISSGVYIYRIKQMDYDGSYAYSKEVNVDYSFPSDFVIYQNYPNPFNPSTNITFSIPLKTNIRLAVMDILGREVCQLYKGELSQGLHSFQFDGSRMSSGTYFVRLESGAFNKTIKIQLMK